MITEDDYDLILDSLSCLHSMSNEYDLAGLDDYAYNKILQALDECIYLIQDSCPLLEGNSHFS
jgi:hypothetical protein